MRVIWPPPDLIFALHPESPPLGKDIRSREIPTRPEHRTETQAWSILTRFRAPVSAKLREVQFRDLWRTLSNSVRSRPNARKAGVFTSFLSPSCGYSASLWGGVKFGSNSFNISFRVHAGSTSR